MPFPSAHIPFELNSMNIGQHGVFVVVVFLWWKKRLIAVTAQLHVVILNLCKLLLHPLSYLAQSI